MNNQITREKAREAVAQYIAVVADKLKTGQAREHAYRPVFETLIKTLNNELQVLNDPSRSEHGNPDFVFLRGDVTVGYTETKDIGVDLNRTEQTQQMERYLGYSNLILTDYLEFRFFKNGERYGDAIIIANVENNTLTPRPENFGALADTLTDFLQGTPEPIKSGKRLAKIMGGKARRIRDNVNHYLATPSDKNEELERVYKTIKQLLVHDLEPDQFADMYAQTLVYGLFVARFHDDTPDNFSRQEARDLIPASNPFLRHFFDHIAGSSFDKRLGFIVTELCDVFSCSDVHALMAQYFEKDGLTEKPDPVIHFYEDFLKEYDSDQRKKMGAFYTPLPVVRFIIRAVDSILEKEFGLPKGLADTSKIELTRMEQNRKIKEQIHRVQILDPAAGTGTFLNETILSIHRRFQDQAGRWKAYVDSDLLPRLYGFELMMAPYTIAHLKLGITLSETGYEGFEKRLGVYLTNSLEEAQTLDGTLFASLGLSQSLAEEARAASRIKKERPIMVVIGNPPYSVSSSNKGKWIQDLIKVYKEGLNERKINLDDDYIKFIRFAEHFIEKNQGGVVAMITNNSYIDGITHRQMRKHLLQTFDEIYILDLHGNAKKKETAQDGGKDENVFAIQQGVAISIFVRTSKQKKSLGKVYHTELFGKRQNKFDQLDAAALEAVNWQTIDYKEPHYFFVPKDFSLENEYGKGLKIDELFRVCTSGVETQKDSLVVKISHHELKEVRNDILGHDDNFIYQKYSIKDTRDWNLLNARKDLECAIDTSVLYRPFDIRWTFYSGKTKGILAYPRNEVMKHLVKENLAIILANRVTSFKNWQHVFVSKNIVERCAVSLQTGEVGSVFPLYLYAQDGTKVPNLNRDIVKQIETVVGETTSENIFDYIYAVLHSPSYREKYKEFLKIDFPRVPYPQNKEQFQVLVDLGSELRSLHLLESPKVNQFITTYPKDGSNLAEKPEYKDGNVYINKEQCFGNVPEVAWNFWIGGYQPAQKWLKDRKGRELINSDIEHYQQMIIALTETNRIMSDIDKVFN